MTRNALADRPRDEEEERASRGFRAHVIFAMSLFDVEQLELLAMAADAIEKRELVAA